MSRLSVNSFRAVNEPLEVHWLAGLKQADDGSWYVRVVTHGLISGKVTMWPLPIGMLPLMTLGLLFEGGRLLESQSRGELQTVDIPNVSDALEVTSANIPPGLYSFFGRQPGVQRLLLYQTSIGNLFIPTIELVRYLLVHNKTLANAIMVPGQLMTLYHFEPVGVSEELTLRFTSDMPIRSVTSNFALEFAWLALHPDGRRAWDSVYTQSSGRDYVSFEVPSIPDASLVFRGVQWEESWLVLELIHLTGREPPCKHLRFGHPGFKRVEGDKPVGSIGKNGKGGKSRRQGTVEVQLSGEQTRVAANQHDIEIGAKSAEFTIAVPIEKLWGSSARQRRRFGKDATCGDTPPFEESTEQQIVVIKGGVGRERTGSSITPLEFNTLESYPWEFDGELQSLADTIRIMASLLVDTEISMARCRLKPGKAFSTVQRRPRCCLVIHIRVAGRQPIVLIDVDRAGEWALSTMALCFFTDAAFAELEVYVKAALDRLVDHGGHWDPTLSNDLQNVCNLVRLPKILPQRDVNKDVRYRTVRAWRLATKLSLPLIDQAEKLRRSPKETTDL